MSPEETPFRKCKISPVMTNYHDLNNLCLNASKKELIFTGCYETDNKYKILKLKLDDDNISRASEYELMIKY